MRKADKCFPFDEKDEKASRKSLGRCEICNYTNDDKTGCAEPLNDIRPESSSVHFYPELKQELCTYCYNLVLKNRKFYRWAFKTEAPLTFNGHQQKDKKAALKLPQMSE